MGEIPGLCEASTVVPWMGGWLVGDNETTDKLFRFGPDMKPVADVPLVEDVDDIEALAPSADGGLWVVGSQSANKDGKTRVTRERIARLGQRAVVPDFTACAPCVAARGIAPNKGGLNVEGAVEIAGKLWLGLRAPLVDGKAIFVETDGEKALRWVTADLGGMGVRELSPWRGGFLVIAGPVDDTRLEHAVWWMASPEATPKRLDLTLPPHAEGLAVDAEGRGIWVTDGDGKSDKPGLEPARWGRVQVKM